MSEALARASAEALPWQPLPEEGGLSDAARRRLAGSFADNTLTAYERQWKEFAAWCARRRRKPFPCTSDDLTNWVAERCDLGHGLSAIRQGIGAVMFVHKHAKKNDPRVTLPDSGDAWRLHTAYRRELADAGVREVRAATVDPDQFRSMVAALPGDTPAGIRDRAILGVGLGGFFRPSNVMRLDVADVQVVPAGDAELYVSRSKTDQAARGRTAVLAPGSNPLSDPVWLLKCWLEELARQGVADGALFRRVSRTGRVLPYRLSDDHVRVTVARAARLAGLSNTAAAPYRAMTLRASGATIADRAGKPMNLICKQGGWVEGSTVVLRYIRPEEHDHAMRGVGL